MKHYLNNILHNYKSLIKNFINNININKINNIKQNHFTNIIKGDNEDNIKICKICDYLLDIFLDIYPEEFEKIDNLEIEEYENLDDESEDNIYEEDKKDNGIKNEDKLGDDFLVFENFIQKMKKN